MSIIAALLKTGSRTEGEVTLSRSAFGPRTTAGVSVSADSAMALAAYYACLRNISEDLAKLPLHVYRRLEPRGRERVKDHPAYRALHVRANDESSAMSVRETLVHHAMGWGGGFAEIVRNGNDPLSLWPIHPSRVKLWRTNAGRLKYRIRLDGGQQTDLNPQDVFHLHGLGGDGLMGYQLSVLAKEAVGLGLEAETFGAAYFGNGTVIRGILEHPGTLSDTARRRLAEYMADEHGGAAKAHGTRILEEGMKWKSMAIPADEAQFLETRQFQVEEIARWFRMPPHKIQHLLRSTFGNIESQAIEYVVDTLTPWATRFEQEAWAKLLDEAPDLYAEHNFSGLLRGDDAKRAAYYQSRFNVGSLSQNDIRELENENPIEGGDEYYVPMNMSRTSDVAKDGVEVEVEAEQEPDPASAGADTAKPSAALAPLAVEAVHRTRAKETKAVSRARNRGDFAAWLVTFSEQQASWLAELLGNVYAASAALSGSGNDPQGAAFAVAESYRALLASDKSTAEIERLAVENMP